MLWYYILLGFAPAVFFLWYFYRKDKWEPEPKMQVLKIFFLGMVSIPFAALVEWLMITKVFMITNISDEYLPFELTIIACFLAIGPIEEFFKYSVVKVFIYPKDDFNEPMDGVVYMIAAAMGFAGLENVMYIINSGNPTFVGIMRGLLATPAHAIFSGFVGLYLGRAKFCKGYMESAGWIILGLFIGTFLHGLYDLLVMSRSFWAIGAIPLLVISGGILIYQVNQLQKNSPFIKAKQKQVEQSTLSL